MQETMHDLQRQLSRQNQIIIELKQSKSMLLKEIEKHKSSLSSLVPLKDGEVADLVCIQNPN